MSFRRKGKSEGLEKRDGREKRGKARVSRGYPQASVRISLSPTIICIIINFIITAAINQSINFKLPYIHTYI